MKSRGGRIFIYGLLLIIGVSTLLMYLSTPYANDDLWYLLPFRDWMSGSGESTYWDIVISTWRERYLTDNTRLANMIVPFTMAIQPKWVMDVLNALMTVMLYMLVVRVAGLGWAKPLWRPVAMIGCVMFLLPWGDQMLLCDFSLNYIWTSVVILAFALLWLRDGNHGHRIGLFVLSAVAGAMHEMASVSLLCGMVVYLLSNRGESSRGRWVMLVGMAVGVTILLTAPGPYVRASESEVNALSFFKSADYYMKCVGRCNVTALLVVITGACCMRGDGRHLLARFFRTPGLAFFVASIVGMVIMFFTEKAPRISWFPQLYGIIAVFILLRNVSSLRFCKDRVIVPIVTAVMLLHLSSTVYWCHRYGEEYKAVVKLYMESPTGVVAYTMADRSREYMTLGRPLCDLFTAEWNLRRFNDYYSPITGNRLTVIDAGREGE